MFTRIVVGDGGGATARDAVVLGEGLAAVTGAGLSLVQAFAPMLISSPGDTDRETWSRQIARQLSHDRRTYAPDAVTEVIADGNAARALGRYAHSWHANLVVIGSSRRAELGRSAMGTTGRGLLATAPLALAIAKRGIRQQGFRLSSVAVGYDGGTQAAVALAFADQIAASAGAELVICTGDEKTLCAGGADISATAASSRIEMFAGAPGPRLRELSGSVDLMVIGSRRWGALAKLVLGGVGEALAADCGASLLIARGPVRAARSQSEVSRALGAAGEARS